MERSVSSDSRGALVNCAYGAKSIVGIQCLIRSFVGLTFASVRMHQKWDSRSRFVKDVASWLRRLVGSQSGQGSGEAPGPSVPSRVRFAPSLQMSIKNVQVLTRMKCRLPSGSCTDLLEVSLQLLDPSERRLAASGGFCRNENIIVLEARSALFAVRCAESCAGDCAMQRTLKQFYKVPSSCPCTALTILTAFLPL